MLCLLLPTPDLQRDNHVAFYKSLPLNVGTKKRRGRDGDGERGEKGARDEMHKGEEREMHKGGG